MAIILVLFPILSIWGFILSQMQRKQIKKLLLKVELLTNRIDLLGRSTPPSPSPSVELETSKTPETGVPPVSATQEDKNKAKVEQTPPPAVKTKAPSPSVVLPPPIPAKEKPSPPPAPPPPEIPQKPKVSLESRIGLGWLPRAGIVAILFSLAFFIKYSFDNDLLPPTARVAIGIFCGIALLVTGEIFQRKKFLRLAHAVSGGGIATLYMSIFGAFYFYQLLSLNQSFLFMSLVTAAAIALAIRYNALVISILSAVGGFLTPVLLKTDIPDLSLLFTFLFILNLGLMGTAFYKRWFSLALLSPICTFILASFAAENYDGKSDDILYLYLFLQSAVFLFTAVKRSWLAVAFLAAFGSTLLPLFFDADHSFELAMGYFLALLILLLGVAGLKKWETLGIATMFTTSIATAFIMESPFPHLLLAFALLYAAVVLFYHYQHTWPPNAYVIALTVSFLFWAAEPRSKYLVLSFTTLSLGLALTVFGLLASSLLRREKTPNYVCPVFLLSGFAYYGAVFALPLPADLRGLFTLGVSAFFAFACAATFLRNPGDRNNAFFLLGVAITFVTLTIPAQFDDQWVTMAWAVESLILLFIGLRRNVPFFQAAALAVSVIVFFRLIFLDAWMLGNESLESYRPFLNARFGSFVFGITAFFVNAWQLSRNQSRAWKVDRTGKSLFPLYCLAGLVLLSYVLGLECHGAWISFSWALVAVAAVLFGFIKELKILRIAGLLLLALTFGRLIFLDLIYPVDTFSLLMNRRFSAYLIAVIATCAIAFLYRSRPGLSEDVKLPLPAIFGSAAVLLLLIASSLEVNSYFDHLLWQARESARFLEEEVRSGVIHAAVKHSSMMKQMTLSCLWGLFATIFILVGILKKIPGLRWASLVLFTLVTAKVFFLDLAGLDAIYRIVSFMVLGIVLLAGSFIYHRFKDRLE